MREDRDLQAVVLHLKEHMTSENLWNAIVQFEGYPFYTCKGLEFTYEVKGGELFFSRKEKSITRATVDIAFCRALERMKTEGTVSGPKKLGVFGASYLYPVFLRLGVIEGGARKRKETLTDDDLS